MEDQNKIRLLNDKLRKTFQGGRVMLTRGFRLLNEELQVKALSAVRAFDDFNEDNDPYGEHDCAVIKLDDDVTIIWKIAYYDNALEFGSSDPSDPSITTRVMTIMCSSEY